MCNFTPTKTLFEMNRLKEMLNSDIVRGVVRTATGEVIEFHSPGVKDLFTLVVSRPNALVGATVADRVIGRGAALLLVLGKVERVYPRSLAARQLKCFKRLVSGLTMTKWSPTPSTAMAPASAPSRN